MLKCERTFRTEEIQMCRLWTAISEELCSALSAMQKTMVWRGLDSSLLLSVLSLRATSTHSSTDLEKMKLCCFLSMMNEMMQQSVRSPTPCADGSESLHRNKSISVCHIKTDDICRQHLECMSCVYEWCIA